MDIMNERMGICWQNEETRTREHSDVVAEMNTKDDLQGSWIENSRMHWFLNGGDSAQIASNILKEYKRIPYAFGVEWISEDMSGEKLCMKGPLSKG